MIRLTMMLYSLISTTFAGTGVIVVLTAGYGTLKPIIIAALIGALIAAPVSWLVADRLYRR